MVKKYAMLIMLLLISIVWISDLNAQISEPTIYYAAKNALNSFKYSDSGPVTFNLPVVSDAEHVIALEEEDLLIWCSCGHSIGKIFISSIDGEDFHTVVETPSQRFLGLVLHNEVLDIAYDHLERRLYWIEQNVNDRGVNSTTTIKSMLLDGSEEIVVLEQITASISIEIDPIEQMIYWLDENAPGIFRSSLDLYSPEEITTDVRLRSHFQLDLENGIIYWESGFEELLRSNSDGTNLEKLTGVGSISGSSFQVDVERDLLYQPNQDASSLIRTDLSSLENHTLVFETNTRILGFGISSVSDDLFIARPQEIVRVSRESLETENVIFGFGLLSSISFDPNNNEIFYTDQGDLLGYNLESGEFRTILVETGNAGDIQFDRISSAVYWNTGSSIRGFPLEQSSFEELILLTPQTQANGIFVDSENGKIYWTDDESIHRANLDGSEIELVIDELQSANKLAVDPKGQKVYWTDSEGVKRANLDGSKEEYIFISSSRVGEILIDFSNSKLYWNISNDGLMLRSDLDGTNVEEVLAGVSLSSMVLKR